MVDLLTLARAAVDDCDARIVLSDAIEETGWWDDRIHFPLLIVNSDPAAVREECLALLTWPGETGARHARVIVEALTTPRPQLPGWADPALAPMHEPAMPLGGDTT